VADLLTISEVADRTGVAIATLRVWESRHGFPVPQRLASGHRRYDSDDVARILDVVRLRESGVRLDAAIGRAVREQLAARSEPTSVFAELRRRHGQLPVHRLGKPTLVGLSHALEDELQSRAERSVAFGAFQRRRFFGSSRSRWAELGRIARAAYVFADFERCETDAGLVTVPLEPDAPMLREWVVVLDGPGLAAALSAWELPGQDDVPEQRRVFEASWTLDPVAVRDFARVCASVAAAAGAPGAATLDEELRAEPTTASLDPVAATALFNRVVAYVDRAQP
jgi:DNA-binding transcriptional MerR regulator